MQTEDTALVLLVKPYKESSKSVVFLTESGVVWELVIHGYNSKKSEYKAIVQPFNQVVLTTQIVNKKRVILACELVDNYPNIKLSLVKIDLLNWAYQKIINLPYALKTAPSQLFLLLLKLQTIVERASLGELSLLKIYFYYSLTYCFGIRPKFIPTQFSPQSEKIYFDLEEGVCSLNQDSSSCMKIDFGVATLLAMVHNSKMEDMGCKLVNKETVERLAKLLSHYFKFQLNLILVY